VEVSDREDATVNGTSYCDLNLDLKKSLAEKNVIGLSGF